MHARRLQGALSPLGPQPSPTSLAALLTHPDSGGVFQLYHDVSHHSSSNFSVELVVQALRRKAARGLVEAVAAAWPGEAPLPRLRRAAALAMACEYDGGPGTPSGNRHVSGEVLAGRLREQLGEEAVPHPVELPQRLSKGDETKLFVVEKRKGVSAGWSCSGVSAQVEVEGPGRRTKPRARHGGMWAVASWSGRYVVGPMMTT